jgi:DNA invertase Pin-like site-specific DNA recombinase
LDRLGRSLGDLIRLTHDLKGRGIGFASLTEQIDTRSPSGQLIFHVFGALAEFERNLIRERTLAGLKAARARGREGGRPKKLGSKDLQTVRALLKSGDIPVSTVTEQFQVARSTLYRNAGVKPVA